jgi:hypothetical protein
MNRFSLGLALLLLSASAGAQTPPPRPSAEAPAPNLAYSQVSGEVVRLLQRVTAAPDAQAVLLMRREGPPLQAKIKRLNPAYREWMRTRSPEQMQAEEQRLMAQPWMKFLNNPDPKLAAKLQRNPELKQRCVALMETIAEGL